MSDNKNSTATSTSTAVAGGKGSAESESTAVSGGPGDVISDSLAVSKGSLIWLKKSNGKVPDDAVEGGVDLSGKKAFVGRAVHGTSKKEEFLVPGRVIPHKGYCSIAIFLIEYHCKDYEVLTNPQNVKLNWVKREVKGPLPKGAVPAGNEFGKIMYIGRRQIEGKWLIGKVHDLEKSLWVPMRGTETLHWDYEVLCEVSAAEEVKDALRKEGLLCK